ncbi:protein kinase [Actinomyces bowdenii]|uniref:protein kinase domain-containing protein n=1 Tax=Actinomyces bowdenii TaxID=131109 RepID=UPI001ABD3794|nr:protein kinase [Actinomyces bowdenii]MBO3725863.1 protein kinase [Actinomyces bowdenii]
MSQPPSSADSPDQPAPEQQPDSDDSGPAGGPGRELRPLTRRRSQRRSRWRRGRQDDGGETEGLPAGLHRALAEAGLTLGVPLGRSLSPAAPRRALDAAGEHVVVRLLDLPEGGAGAGVLRRLAALRGLRHHGLVPIREVISLPGNRVAVVMDLIDGASLDVVLGARGRLPLGQMARLLDDLGSALAHMHEHGCAHGDISAGNVVIRLDGAPVLVDLLGSFMESGTQGCAAPERLAGGPATAASDVYALAALVRECAGTGGAGARRATRVLADALVLDPQERPSARDLAARAPEMGVQAPIELPDGARLAAGSLRAAARTPTRTVGSRLQRSRRRAPVVALTYGQARPQRGWVTGRRRLVGAAAIIALASTGWALTHPASTTVALRSWPLSALAPRSAGQQASSAPAAPAPGPDGSSAPPPAPHPPASREDGGASAAAADQAAAQTSAAADDGGEMTAVVLALASARDEALMAGDAAGLAATTVPGSPAAQADAGVMGSLLASGESIEGLQTSVSQVQEAEVPDEVAAAWPGARAVRLTQAQGPYTRRGEDGARTVPALAPRQVVLVLVPGPWRVLEVGEAP